MSLLDKASIVWPKGAPSKAGNLAAWNPQTSQLVEFDVVRATTKTYVDENGLIQTAAANVLPRDFTDGGCGVQKIEPQRTNYVTSSQDFSAVVSATETTGQESPTTAGNEGTIITGDGTSTQPRTVKSLSFASAGAKVQYCIAKAGTNDFLALGFQAYTGGSGTSFSFFDLNNGTTPTAGAKIVSIGNGWYFCISAPYTIDAGDLSGVNSIFLTPDDSNLNWPTAAAANGQSINLFHFQAEDGDYSTTPIFTSGSTVTRNADVASLSSAAALLNNASGGFFIEASVYEDTFNGISISDGTSNNRFRFGTSSSGRFTVVSSTGGTLQTNEVSSSGLYTINTFFKIAVGYTTNDVNLYHNGSSVITDTSWLPIVGADRLELQDPTGGPFYGDIKQVVYFNNRPTDAQLSAITT